MSGLDPAQHVQQGGGACCIGPTSRAQQSGQQAAPQLTLLALQPQRTRLLRLHTPKLRLLQPSPTCLLRYPGRLCAPQQRPHKPQCLQAALCQQQPPLLQPHTPLLRLQPLQTPPTPTPSATSLPLLPATPLLLPTPLPCPGLLLPLPPLLLLELAPLLCCPLPLQFLQLLPLELPATNGCIAQVLGRIRGHLEVTGHSLAVVPAEQQAGTTQGGHGA